MTLPIAWALAALLPSAPPAVTAWVPTLQSEFNDTVLDTTVWSAVYQGTGIWNGEAEAYVPSQVSVSGGSLHLKAEKKPTQVFGVTQPYASGIVTTLGKWSQRYGYFEIQARVPAGKGLWPAFWGLPASGAWPPEIDVLEILGDTPRHVHMTSHWGLLPLHLSEGTDWNGPDFSAGLHRFAVDWTPRHLRWYVDDTLRAENLQGVSNVPFYWILNLAVGGTWPGYPDSTTTFPSEFQVDWMRAWQYPPDSLAAFPVPDGVHFTAPRHGQILTLGQPIRPTLVVDSGPVPATVRWFDQDAFLGTSTSLSLPWTPSFPGSHPLRAVAITAAGAWSDFVGTMATVADSTGNLLVNGNFSDATNGWSLWLQSGCVAVADTQTWEGAVRGIVRPTVPGSQAWYVQFSQPLPLLRGWTYQISWKASATASRSLQAMIQQGADPYTVDWSKNLSVGLDSASYGPYSFTSPVDDSTATFKFNLGVDTAAIRLWNVRVTATAPLQAVQRHPVGSPRPVELWDLQGRRIPAGPNPFSGLALEHGPTGTRRVVILAP